MRRTAAAMGAALALLALAGAPVPAAGDGSRGVAEDRRMGSEVIVFVVFDRGRKHVTFEDAFQALKRERRFNTVGSRSGSMTCSQ